MGNLSEDCDSSVLVLRALVAMARGRLLRHSICGVLGDEATYDLEGL